jgi:hypothetical protein
MICCDTTLEKEIGYLTPGVALSSEDKNGVTMLDQRLLAGRTTGGCEDGITGHATECNSVQQKARSA